MSNIYHPSAISSSKDDFNDLAALIMQDVISSFLINKCGQEDWKEYWKNWVIQCAEGKKNVSDETQKSIRAFYNSHRNNLKFSEMDVSASWAVIRGLSVEDYIREKEFKALDHIRYLRNIAVAHKVDTATIGNAGAKKRIEEEFRNNTVAAFKRILQELDNSDVLHLNENTKENIEKYINGVPLSGSTDTSQPAPMMQRDYLRAQYQKALKTGNLQEQNTIFMQVKELAEDGTADAMLLYSELLRQNRSISTDEELDKMLDASEHWLEKGISAGKASAFYSLTELRKVKSFLHDARQGDLNANLQVIEAFKKGVYLPQCWSLLCSYLKLAEKNGWTDYFKTVKELAKDELWIDAISQLVKEGRADLAVKAIQELQNAGSNARAQIQFLNNCHVPEGDLLHAWLLFKDSREPEDKLWEQAKAKYAELTKKTYPENTQGEAWHGLASLYYAYPPVAPKDVMSIFRFAGRQAEQRAYALANAMTYDLWAADLGNTESERRYQEKLNGLRSEYLGASELKPYISDYIAILRHFSAQDREQWRAEFYSHEIRQFTEAKNECLHKIRQETFSISNWNQELWDGVNWDFHRKEQVHKIVGDAPGREYYDELREKYPEERNTAIFLKKKEFWEKYVSEIALKKCDFRYRKEDKIKRLKKALECFCPGYSEDLKAIVIKEINAIEEEIAEETKKSEERAKAWEEARKQKLEQEKRVREERNRKYREKQKRKKVILLVTACVAVLAAIALVIPRILA